MSAVVDIPTDVAALEHCREITRREARNFYYGLKLLPEPQRSALYCIYAWMRRADDIVDDGDAAADENLRQFRELTHAALEESWDGDDPDPMWRAFAATTRRFQLSAEPFEAMIDGQRADLSFRQPDTMDGLVQYCRQVASSVGRVCVAIWGADDPRAMELADDRGIAFQLTNILRDVREDHENGRVYLPIEMLTSRNLTIESLLAWRDPAACHDLLAELAGAGEAHYVSSSPLEAMITPSCRPTLRAMTRIYHGLLHRIRKNPRIIVGPRRVRLGRLRKISIALSARMQARIS
ncbi:MAG: phytoene/squalene synthase family protein [Phycisphaerales bacterium]|nr:phytoene/squalene synthase family protein [Phycisphaerales bacterium]